MLLIKMDIKKIVEGANKYKDVADLYRAIGISPKEEKGDYVTNFDDEKVFGKRAHYRNMFMDDGAYKEIERGILENREKSAKDARRVQTVQTQWAWYSPVSCGERYEDLKKRIGEINHSVLYIITPEDDMYEPAPELN